ncbi:MAG: PD-(D/E)XK nuclease family protein [Terriglobales bacterium]
MATDNLVKVGLPENVEVAAMIPPLSQSRYELMACPHLYRERVVLGRREAPNPYADRGTQIHRAIAEYISHLVKARLAKDETYFDEILGRGYSEEVTDILDGFKDSLVIDPEQVLGAEMYLALDEEFKPLEFNEDRSDWRGAGDPDFEGTLDLVLLPTPTEADIFDWKSFWQIVDAESFQSKFYPLLVFKHYPHIQTVRFHLQFVRYGVSRSVEFRRDRDLEKLEKLARQARARHLALHAVTGAASAMPGPHCLYCPLLTDGCPVGAINPYAEQSAEDRARFAIWLIQAKKKNDGILKEIVNAGGPVRVQDDNGNAFEAGFQLKYKSGYPLKDCYPLIAVNDPELVSKLTISGLSSPLKAKKRAGLREMLEPLAVSTASTRFGISGVEEEEEF